MSSIFLIHDSGDLVEMRESPYDSEDLLQNLLDKYPKLLAGDQINASQPRRWLLVCREMSVPGEEGGSGRWSLDHLFLDQAAIPTLVEVKRSTDTRIRRQVVGQMLDYAANAVAYWPVEEIKARFESRCKEDGVEPDAELAGLLGEGQDASTFWQQVKTNLQAGRSSLDLRSWRRSTGCCLRTRRLRASRRCPREVRSSKTGSRAHSGQPPGKNRGLAPVPCPSVPSVVQKPSETKEQKSSTTEHTARLARNRGARLTRSQRRRR